MDNRVFNINGQSKEMLLNVLKLAFEQEGCKFAKSWLIDPMKGLILFWSDGEERANLFPVPLSPEGVLEIVWAYLQNPETWNTVEFDRNLWEDDLDHDGSNIHGWRVYCENWGIIEDDCHDRYDYSFIAIKPCWLWLGK